MRGYTCLLPVIFLAALQTDAAQPRRAIQLENADVQALRLRAEAALVPAPLACGSAPVLACGATQTASPSCLSGNFYVDLYTFNAIAGQTLTVHGSTTTSYQILVTIQASSGTILVSNYSPATTSVSYTFPTSGMYFIGVGFVAQFATGPYTLQLTCTTSPPGGCVTVGSLAVGGSITSQLVASLGNECLSGGPNYYSTRYALSATVNVPVDVTLASQFHPYLLVGQSDDLRAIYAQGKSPGSITITYLPTYTGVHYVYVSSYLENETGAFTVSVTATQLDPCRRRAVTH